MMSSTKNLEKISVIVPVYNGEKYIKECLQSIQAQSKQPDEILVVDDGSTDASAAIAQSFPSVHVIQQNHCGVSSAMNAGVSASKGTYLSFLDSDDLWVPHKLQTQLEIIKKDPTICLVFGQIKQFVSPELSQEQKKDLTSPNQPEAGYSTGTLFLSKDQFLKVGLFNEDIVVGPFVDWYLRAKDLNLTTHMASDVFMRRRIHKSNMGLREKDNQKDYARILKAALDRRRSKNLC